MPEIPEVEAFKVYVNHTSLRKKIINVKSVAKRLIKKVSFKDFKKTLINKKFTHATRRGKYLIIDVSNSNKKIVMHFGLTGSLSYQKDTDTPVKYSKVTFIFAGNAALHWINKRKFGHIWLVDTLDEIKGLKNLGPDPLKLTQKQFISILQAHADKNIKACLMDQELMAGIGNEYSDEILFQAGIDPHHKVQDLSEKELKKLYTKMKSTLTYFIKLRKKNMKELGTEEFFSDADRKTIKSSYLQAHRHLDNKCPKNKNHTLKKATIAGRSAYYCPKDQK